MKRFKCTAISDTHCVHDKVDVGSGDFLFHSGDATFFGQPDEVYPFLDWMAEQDFTHKVFIAGNHDFGFEPMGYGDGNGQHCSEDGRFGFRHMELRKGLENEYRQYAEERGITYLDKEVVILDGISIYGIPDQPYFYGWAFQYSDDEKAKTVFSRIPNNLDILITHGPPKDILDKVTTRHPAERCGCPILADSVHKKRPRYHIFGHIHDSYGMLEKDGTTYINAATCDHEYRPTNPPIKFILVRK
jgi:hypothetical protein